jgi:hypothetical protein
LACAPLPYKSSINARSDILSAFESYESNIEQWSAIKK